MTRNIALTTSVMAALALVTAGAAIPAFAQFDTTNTASQTSTQTGTATGGAGGAGGLSVLGGNANGGRGGDASVDQGVCQQIAQSGAFGSSTNRIRGSDCS